MRTSSSDWKPVKMRLSFGALCCCEMPRDMAVSVRNSLKTRFWCSCEFELRSCPHKLHSLIHQDPHPDVRCMSFESVLDPYPNIKNHKVPQGHGHRVTTEKALGKSIGNPPPSPCEATNLLQATKTPKN